MPRTKKSQVQEQSLVSKLIPRDVIMENPIRPSRKSYNIVLPSHSGTTVGFGASQVAYNFDWSVLDNQPYKVYFSFASTAFTNTTDTFVNGMIQTDLFYNSTQYIINATSQHAGNSDIIGVFESRISNNATGSTTKLYFFADKNTNPPLYITERPKQNLFYILVSTIQPSTPNTEFWLEGAKYTMILHFEPCD
jgi:hypothetical protein